MIPESDTLGWRVKKLEWDAMYGDYGAPTYVEFLSRRVKSRTLTLVFMYANDRGPQMSEREYILKSFRETAVDSARPPMTREVVLDSLQAGRKRWARAAVGEYQLQSHLDCFCVYAPEAFRTQWPLLTIRNGAIIARTKGTADPPPSPEATVEGLFARVEEDARTDGRVIDSLELDPLYGFPIEYRAHDSQILDDWLQVRVDIFSVIRRH